MYGETLLQQRLFLKHPGARIRKFWQLARRHHNLLTGNQPKNQKIHFSITSQARGNGERSLVHPHRAGIWYLSKNVPQIVIMLSEKYLACRSWRPLLFWWNNQSVQRTSGLHYCLALLDILAPRCQSWLNQECWESVKLSICHVNAASVAWELLEIHLESSQNDSRGADFCPDLPTDSLYFAAVGGFLQILVQFDDPLLIFLLLNLGHLLQLTGPLVLQHLSNESELQDWATLMGRIHVSPYSVTTDCLWHISTFRWHVNSMYSLNWWWCYSFFCYLLCIKMLRGHCVHILVRQRVAQLVHHLVHLTGLPVREMNVHQFDWPDGELQDGNNK